MSTFETKDVKRAIRDLQVSIDDIISADSTSYRTKIDSFIGLTKTNPIIKMIVDPFREIELDFDNIHSGSRIKEIRLPSTVDERVAYIIQLFDKVIDEEYPLDKFAYTIYNYRTLSENVNTYLNSIAVPRLRELQAKLNDLIEDEVEGKSEVSSGLLQIISNSTITAHQGSNIGFGKDIQQTAVTSNKSERIKKIVETALREAIIDEDQVAEVEKLAEEVQNEIEKPESTDGRLKYLANAIYKIGEEGLLKVFTTVITDPRWGQAVANLLLNI